MVPVGAAAAALPAGASVAVSLIPVPMGADGVAVVDRMGVPASTSVNEFPVPVPVWPSAGFRAVAAASCAVTTPKLDPLAALVGICSTSKVTSTVQVWGWSTFPKMMGEPAGGTSCTLPSPGGPIGETVNAPLQTAPDVPVALVIWNTPGSQLATGQSTVTVPSPQLGTRVMDVTRIPPLPSMPVEALEMVTVPVRPVSPTVTGLGKLTDTSSPTAALAGWMAILRTTGSTIPIASNSAAADGISGAAPVVATRYSA